MCVLCYRCRGLMAQSFARFSLLSYFVFAVRWMSLWLVNLNSVWARTRAWKEAGFIKAPDGQGIAYYFHSLLAVLISKCVQQMAMADKETARLKSENAILKSKLELGNCASNFWINLHLDFFWSGFKSRKRARCRRFALDVKISDCTGKRIWGASVYNIIGRKGDSDVLKQKFEMNCCVLTFWHMQLKEAENEIERLQEEVNTFKFRPHAFSLLHIFFDTIFSVGWRQNRNFSTQRSGQIPKFGSDL